MSKQDNPTAWGCKTCFKFDWAHAGEAMAKPEHVPYRGSDIGTCKGSMIPLYEHPSNVCIVRKQESRGD